MGSQGPKPHAVCVPFPLIGHINPLLKFAKLLHHKGFHITFVNTEFNHERILKSRGLNALDGLPDFQFDTISIEHPPSNGSVAQTLGALRETYRQNYLTLFRNLLTKLNNIENAPPVTCLISDGVLNFSVIAAEEFGIPCALFWNISANGFISNKNCRHLIAKCFALPKGESNEIDESLDALTEWIPGMKGVRVRDIPNIIQATDKNGYLVEMSLGELERISKASAIICHTFDALEMDVLDNVSSMYRRVYSIGPVQLLLDQIQEDPCKSIECNLWNEETECIQWLNSKEPNSVVYISFGSYMSMTSEKIVELAWGLANSNYHFLWIVRPDMVVGESAVLPQEFLLETKDRALIVSWCPQEQVLKHAAIGGFITHCGWNSILESISGEVPMICFPFFGEQFTNSRDSCNEWGIGMELSDDFCKDKVEKLVRELMEGERGKKMKGKVLEWKHMAEEATSLVGSSSINLENLVNEVLLPKD